MAAGLVMLMWIPGGVDTIKAAVFPKEEAFRIEAVVPVLNEDVNQAHQRAVDSGFRQAAAAGLKKLTGELEVDQGRLGEPSRFIRAYQIEEQTRQDLYYRLKMLIWVDAQSLEELVRNRRKEPLAPAIGTFMGE
jgi:hypothetical protein